MLCQKLNSGGGIIILDAELNFILDIFYFLFYFFYCCCRCFLFVSSYYFFHIVRLIYSTFTHLFFNKELIFLSVASKSFRFACNHKSRCNDLGLVRRKR